MLLILLSLLINFHISQLPEVLLYKKLYLNVLWLSVITNIIYGVIFFTYNGNNIFNGSIILFCKSIFIVKESVLR